MINLNNHKLNQIWNVTFLKYPVQSNISCIYIYKYYKYMFYNNEYK